MLNQERNLKRTSLAKRKQGTNTQTNKQTNTQTNKQQRQQQQQQAKTEI